MEYRQDHLLRNYKACRGLEAEEEERMGNTWYMAEDWWKETVKEQVTQH